MPEYLQGIHRTFQRVRHWLRTSQEYALGCTQQEIAVISCMSWSNDYLKGQLAAYKRILPLITLPEEVLCSYCNTWVRRLDADVVGRAGGTNLLLYWCGCQEE